MMSLGALRNRLTLAITRAVLRLVDDAGGLQVVQAEGMADETLDGVERIQEYGLTSVPFPGATAVIVCAGAHRNHPLVIAVDDQRYRPTALAEGEVAIYDDLGNIVHLRRDGIMIEAPGKVTVQAPEITVAAEQKLRLEAARVEIAATAGVHIGCAGVGPTYLSGAVVSYTNGIPKSEPSPSPVESR